MAEIRRLARVVSNVSIANGIYQLELDCPDIARQALPGQFVTLPPLDQLTTWRRPFTVYKRSGGWLTIVYHVVGRNTALYANLRENEEVSLIGPCGRPAEIDKSAELFYLVAGGCGLAPLHYLAGRIIIADVAIKLVAGFTSVNQIFGINSSYDWIGQDNIKVATDDGSRGYHGNAFDLFRETVNADAEGGNLPAGNKVIVFTCGPRPLMKAVAGLSQSLGFNCYAVLEARMACGGMGACCGCIVETNRGRLKVCEHGPVFDASEVIWDEC